jgi:hypothetical protein
LSSNRSRLRAQPVRQRHRERTRRLLAHPENVGDSLWNEGGIGERRQLDQPDAITEPLEHGLRNLEAQPGLAHARCTDESDQALRAEERRDLNDLALAADEARQVRRQVVTCLGFESVMISHDEPVHAPV